MSSKGLLADSPKSNWPRIRSLVLRHEAESITHEASTRISRSPGLSSSGWLEDSNKFTRIRTGEEQTSSGAISTMDEVATGLPESPEDPVRRDWAGIAIIAGAADTVGAPFDAAASGTVDSAVEVGEGWAPTDADLFLVMAARKLADGDETEGEYEPARFVVPFTTAEDANDNFFFCCLFRCFRKEAEFGEDAGEVASSLSCRGLKKDLRIPFCRTEEDEFC